MNSVNLYGRLTKDVELKYTTSQKAVVRFNIAVNDGFGDKQQTHFITIEAWNKTAENISKFLGKGSEIVIKGRLKHEQFKTKEGQEVNKLIVVSENVYFCGGKKEQSASDLITDTFDGIQFDPDVDNNEVPF